MLEIKIKARGKLTSMTTCSIMLLLLLLNACGQYGPLYLPSIPSTPKNNSVMQQKTQQEKQEEKSVINNN